MFPLGGGIRSGAGSARSTRWADATPRSSDLSSHREFDLLRGTASVAPWHRRAPLVPMLVQAAVSCPPALLCYPTASEQSGRTRCVQRGKGVNNMLASASDALWAMGPPIDLMRRKHRQRLHGKYRIRLKANGRGARSNMPSPRSPQLMAPPPPMRRPRPMGSSRGIAAREVDATHPLGHSSVGTKPPTDPGGYSMALF